MHFRRAETQFVRIVIARLHDTGQDVAELGFIVDEP